MAKPRTIKRSRSGAHTPCPHCGKQLRGEKGLKMHVTLEHQGASQPVRKAVAQ